MKKHTYFSIARGSISHKQQGATLFTALVFLALMTIVSVSAARISMIDVLVSGNNQQQMELYQRTAREIDDHATGKKLLTLFGDDETKQDVSNPWTYDYDVTDAKSNTLENITNRNKIYQCEGINGLATSQGSENKCHLFDFEVKTNKKNSSARDRHARGAGKVYPTASRNNFNNF